VQMSRGNGLLARVAAITALLTIAAAGCSDPKRTADRKVREEVDAAQRLAYKALGLMAGAVYKVDGQVAPLIPPRGRAAEVTDVQPAAALHPRAWEDLEAAERRLSEVLRQHGQAASDDIQGLAYATLGQVLIVKGHYQDFSAKAPRDEAMEAIVQAERDCLTAGAWAALLDRQEQSGSDVAAEAEKMLSSARSDIEGLKTRIAQTTETMASFRKTIQSLQARSEELIPKARNLRVDIQLASGQKGMELIDQVLSLEKEVNENASSIAGIEGNLELREAELRDLEEARKEAEARVEVASSIIEARQATATRRAGEQASVRAALDKARSQARQAADRVVGACRDAAKAEDVAADAYDLAAKKLEHAVRLQDSSGRAAALGEQADALWALGNLQARRLELRGRCLRLVERISAAWAADQPAPQEAEGAKAAERPKSPPPEFAMAILQYLPEAEQVRTAAEANYELAAGLYGQAADSVAPQVRWLYQGHQAAVHLAFHQLTNRYDVLLKARTTLDEALKDKRESPYLAYLLDLERLAKSRQ